MSVGTVAFGKRLKQLRQERGITQEDLASTIGIKDSKTVRNWERGKHGPKFHHLEALAEVLGVPMQSLLDFSDLPENP